MLMLLVLIFFRDKNILWIKLFAVNLGSEPLVLKSQFEKPLNFTKLFLNFD